MNFAGNKMKVRLMTLVFSVVFIIFGSGPLMAAEKNPGEMLLEAVSKGQEAQAANLIEKKDIDLEYRDESGRTPLLLSVANNNHTLAKTLIEAGADADARDNAGQTALMYALKSRDMEILSMLLDKGVNLELRSINGDTALIYAAKSSDEEQVQLLLDTGAETENVDNDGWTALFYAATSGRMDTRIVSLLLSRGTQVDAKDKYGYTALMYVIELGATEMVVLLIDNGANLKVRYPEGKLLVQKAIAQGHNDIAQFLAERGAEVDKESAKILDRKQ